MELPAYIKFRKIRDSGEETYLMICVDRDFIRITFNEELVSVVFGSTEINIDSETYARAMIERHEEISVEEFNEKIQDYNTILNDFIEKKRTITTCGQKPKEEEFKEEQSKKGEVPVQKLREDAPF